jgi:hypothetical protein
MTRGRDTVIGVVVVYVGVSLAAGTVAFAGARWAHAHFLAAATGDAVEELGPAFIETVLIGLAVTASVLAPVVSVVVGITLGRGLFRPGTRHRDRGRHRTRRGRPRGCDRGDAGLRRYPDRDDLDAVVSPHARRRRGGLGRFGSHRGGSRCQSGLTASTRQ